MACSSCFSFAPPSELPEVQSSKAPASPRPRRTSSRRAAPTHPCGTSRASPLSSQPTRKREPPGACPPSPDPRKPARPQTETQIAPSCRRPFPPSQQGPSTRSARPSPPPRQPCPRPFTDSLYSPARWSPASGLLIVEVQGPPASWTLSGGAANFPRNTGINVYNEQMSKTNASPPCPHRPPSPQPLPQHVLHTDAKPTSMDQLPRVSTAHQRDLRHSSTSSPCSFVLPSDHTPEFGKSPCLLTNSTSPMSFSLPRISTRTQIPPDSPTLAHGSLLHQNSPIA